jgi:hypothetical protein
MNIANVCVRKQGPYENTQVPPNPLLLVISTPPVPTVWLAVAQTAGNVIVGIDFRSSCVAYASRLCI